MHRTWIVLLLFTSFFAHGSSFVHLNGSGASFPEPIYQKWFKDFSYRDNDARINYEAVGSGDGISQFINGDVDFAASDLAMSDEQLSYLEQGAVMVPLIAGQVSLIYNLPSVSDLKLSRDVYSRIFLGEIQYWDHPDIQASNPGIQLPAKPITLVVRSDASGSSFLFSNHLALVSESFRNNIGASKLPEWSDQPYFLSALHNQGGHSFCASDRGCYWLC
ncbi:hypothetical protein A3715_12595 [Oleiphilus sp. HI0009]|uniref:phosphate ABC transporter substrate-binding protein PstS n=1 Tax=Oleiphilus sp. HI0125 TaxID=1822266 RepID=UPI0007C383AD|nr:phosphate ABC transporter substrate-binding protein PstS [Oleiphilus sp. HI0125]KZX74007.1 hypothetical protein A3715_24435 [Oleiphilus sp. HI0009]KZX76625.1 hypothetical protein A3715_12595 [Oleiphilus sp. HI0009]KZZ56334.1 hypothetical protein A3762_11170 [Oleiphilus sp. HI0125]